MPKRKLQIQFISMFTRCSRVPPLPACKYPTMSCSFGVTAMHFVWVHLVANNYYATVARLNDQLTPNLVNGLVQTI